ncbi:MAG: cohesin domain-containing protein [Planctomycetota bacterium]
MSWKRSKLGRNHPAALGVLVALFGYTATKGIEPLPLVQPPQPVTSTPVDRLTAEAIQRAAAATAACTFSTECNDGHPCTSDVCSNGVCSNVPIAHCVPCSPSLLCLPMDVVFVMDTSGSMRDEAAALCAGIGEVIADLNAQGAGARATVLGITQTPGGSFACLTDNVVHLLGGAVPGNAGSCPFPDGTSPYESWGPAMAIVAARFPWTPGALRIVVPISDEGPCDGSRPEGCNDPGNDRDSIDNAIAVALANNVVVSPITGTGSDGCVINLAEDAAFGTGGLPLQTKDPNLDLKDAIRLIVVDHCGIDYRCDDHQACTQGDTCSDGVCVGTPIPGCGSCTADTECDDQNPCTLDSCVAGACSSTPNYDVATKCCNPLSGAVVTVDDGNPCTFDQCDRATGEVTHPPSPQGTICDDQQPCTAMDKCDGAGRCQGTDLGAVPCTSNADCFGLTCDLTTGFCTCGNNIPEICVTAVPGSLPEPGCFSVGEDLFVTLDLGSSNRTIVGGQFLIGYDPTVLDFIDIEPGAFVDPESPFGLELLRIVNEGEGTIFYAVSIFLATNGTHGPAMLARIRFRPLQACRSADGLCFLSNNPADTILVNDQGHRVPFTTCCTGELVIHDGAPEMQCPNDQAINADAGALSALVTWPRPTARGQCDGALNVQCHALNEAAVPFESLIPTGGRFPVGHFEFECTATDSCGASSSCRWSADVRNSNTVEVNVQLSALMTPNLLHRCIEFEFYQNCTDEPVVIEQTLDFGGMFNFPGYVHSVVLKVPPGPYGCVTARDPRHTLRSAAHPVIIHGKYVVAFKGDPMLGGNWLLNGNLNGDRVIDLLDHALLLAQYSATMDPSTPCDTGSAIHADLNGDGFVDTNDLTFILRNFLATDKGACCGTASGGAAASEPSVISVEDLDALGLSDLRDADADHDGFLNAEEIMAYLQGEWSAEDPPPAAPGDQAP